jgi:hypothetical protein
VTRLLVLAFLLGAAAYVLIPPVPQGGQESGRSEVQGDHNDDGPLRTAWGPTLQSLREQPPDYATTAPSSRQTEKAVDASTTPANGSAKIALATALHSKPSVSSPTIGFYGPGAELKVVGALGGWFQVVDPATQQRGWVFYRYLTSGGPTPAQAAVAAAEPPPVKAKSSTSRKPSHTRKFVVRDSHHDEVAIWHERRRQWARGNDRRRGCGLFGFRCRQVEQSAWSLGPAR